MTPALPSHDVSHLSLRLAGDVAVTLARHGGHACGLAAATPAQATRSLVHKSQYTTSGGQGATFTIRRS